MCIVFVYSEGESSTDDTISSNYKLILASNRDEFYFRPAKPAHCWESDPHVIGGMDMEPGRQGGTWLAMSPLRKRIGVLLNLPNVPTTSDSQGRGSIVSDFVMGNATPEQYFRQIGGHSKSYNPFNLVTINIGSAGSVTFYSNFDKTQRSYEDSVLSFGNSLPETPLRKSIFGKDRFREIISQHTAPDSKENLVKDLLDFLKWNKKHLPDPELARRPLPSDELSSVFVDIPKQQYGTRTHTIILVDRNNNYDFYEWTKIEEQVDWLKTHLHGTIG